MYRLPSYKPDGRNHCWFGSQDTPCYGRVELYDSFYDEATGETEVVWNCEGHIGCWSVYVPFVYEPSSYPRDVGTTPVDDDSEDTP